MDIDSSRDSTTISSSYWGDDERLPLREPFQLMAPDGGIVEADIDVSCEELPQLYELMAVARGVDEEAVNLQRQGQLGVYAPSRGQEAIQVAAAQALLPETDWILPAYREIGTAIAWGVDPSSILHMWRGSWFSDYDYREFRYAQQTIPVATQLLHATGFAHGATLRGTSEVVLTFVGDGSTSEGDFHEALNFASTWHVPCVFVIQNNQYAISVPFKQQTAVDRLAYRGVGYGMPSVVVDGNDVLASLRVCRQAVERAREGGGPSLIEAVTYRMGAHTTSDDPTRYRTETEEEAWAQFDPLRRVEVHLEKEGLWDDALKERVRGRVRRARLDVREKIYEAPHGDPMELFEHVYVDDTGHYERQRQLLRAELDASQQGGS